MMTLAIIVACIATMFAIQMVRGNPGRAVADTALLVIVIGLITLVEMVVGQFIETHDVGQMLAIAFAVGYSVFVASIFIGIRPCAPRAPMRQGRPWTSRVRSAGSGGGR